MLTVISSTEAARHLGDYLARIKYKGETFILTRNDQPLAQLSPVAGTYTRRGESFAMRWRLCP